MLKKSPPSEKPSFTKYEKLVIFILAFSQFTVVLDFMIISPLGYIMTKELSMTTAQFTHVVSAYAFSAGISGFLSALYADKFDRKKMLSFFYAGFILGTLCCGLANSYSTLFLARIITGIFGGVIGSITTAIVADIFVFKHRGRVMGLMMMAFSVSQVLGLPIGIKIANSFNWEATFMMIVGISTIMLFVIIFKLKPINAHLSLKTKQNPFFHLWKTISNKSHLVGFATIGLASLGGFMIMPFSSIFTVNNLGIPKEDLPLIFAATGIATMAIMPLMGKLSDRVNKFYLCGIMSLLCIPIVVYYTRMSITPLWELIGVNVLMFATIMGRIVPIQSLNSGIPDVKNRGAYMSISSSVQQVSGALGALISGMIVVQASPIAPIQHFDVLGTIIAFLFIVVIGLVYFMNKIIDKKIRENTI